MNSGLTGMVRRAVLIAPSGGLYVGGMSAPFDRAQDRPILGDDL